MCNIYVCWCMCTANALFLCLPSSLQLLCATVFIMDITPEVEGGDRQLVVLAEDMPTDRVYVDENIGKMRKKVTIQWDSLTETNREQFSAVGKKLTLDKLAFDVRLEEGQARPMDPEHVAHLKEALLIRPPLRLLSCLVWDNGSVPSTYGKG